MNIKSKPKAITYLIIAGVILIVAFLFFSSKDKNKHNTYTVQRGTVVQSVDETGTVKKGDTIDLSFKQEGEIKQFYVKIGDKVVRGQRLAQLDNSQLAIQVQQAKAGLELAKAELDKLLSGASPEEIQVAQTNVDNAKNSLKSAKQNLENIYSKAEEDLNESLKDAFNTLNDGYLKLYNSFATARLIKDNYFTDNSQDSLVVKEAKEKIEDDLGKASDSLNDLDEHSDQESIMQALNNFVNYLSETRDKLEEIRTTVEKPIFRSVVSTTDKTSLDTRRSDINTAYSSIVDDRQTILSVKISNTTKIDTAKNSVTTAQDNLQSAQDNLALVKAGPRQEDVDLYQAKEKSAQAQLNLLEDKLNDSTLKSPMDGQVGDIYKYAGEVVQPSTPVLSILPKAVLDIEVNIYEEDIVKIKQGDVVNISLVAFPKQTLEGTVMFIEPAEKLIDGVVYYTVDIAFKDLPKGVKPGMSADVSIIVNKADNVLAIPSDSFTKQGDKTFVKVLRNQAIEDREIKIGLKGNNDLVQVIKGLQEGEKIIID